MNLQVYTQYHHVYRHVYQPGTAACLAHSATIQNAVRTDCSAAVANGPAQAPSAGL